MTEIRKLFKNEMQKQQLLEWYKTMIYNHKAEKYGLDKTYEEFIYKRIEHIKEKLK